MSPDPIVARAGELDLTAEQVQVLARRVGLPPTTSVEEVAAEVNGAPIAASHVNRAVKRDKVIAAAVADGRVEASHRGEVLNAYIRSPRSVERSLVAAAAAPAGSGAMTREHIDAEIAAAVADGRIPGSAQMRWRAVLASRGAAGVSELRSLQSPAAIIAAAKVKAAAEQEAAPEPPSLLVAKPFSLVGNVDEGAAAAKAADQLAAPVAASADVVSDSVSGELSWQGLPVTAAADGTPLVHTTGGAMSVEAFKAAGLNAEAERAAVGLAHLTGTAAKTGLPGRNPLFNGTETT